MNYGRNARVTLRIARMCLTSRGSRFVTFSAVLLAVLTALLVLDASWTLNI